MPATDDFFAGKRPWSLIKDEVLGNYMSPYMAKVNKLGQPILLIDGYAGPGVFDDGKPGSPLIMCEAAEKFAKGNYRAIFVNKKKQHHLKLTSILLRAGWASTITIHGDSTKILQALPMALGNQTVFLYLDPFGPTGCEFSLLEPFLQRGKQASTEIILMMHMPIIHRLAARRQVQEGKWEQQRITAYHARLTKVFGGDYWKEMMWDENLNAQERERKLIDAYSARLKQYLPYTGYCPVQEQEDTRIKYFIVFVSRHTHTLLLMNDIMAKAYHGHMLRQNFQGTLFEGITDWREMRPSSSLEILKGAIKQAVAEKQGQTRKDLWTQVLLRLVPEYFMQFTEADYRQKVQEMVENGTLSCPTPRKTRRLNDDCMLFLPS